MDGVDLLSGDFQASPVCCSLSMLPAQICNKSRVIAVEAPGKGSRAGLENSPGRMIRDFQSTFAAFTAVPGDSLCPTRTAGPCSELVYTSGKPTGTQGTKTNLLLVAVRLAYTYPQISRQAK